MYERGLSKLCNFILKGTLNPVKKNSRQSIQLFKFKLKLASVALLSPTVYCMSPIPLHRKSI